MGVYEMLGDNGEVIGFFKGKVEPEFFPKSAQVWTLSGEHPEPGSLIGPEMTRCIRSVNIRSADNPPEFTL